VSFPLHSCLLFCTVCSTPMRFPRVKPEGQSFYRLRFQGGRLSIHVSRLSATVRLRPKDQSYVESHF